MDNLEKVRILLPHWIAHTRSHADEFGQWAANLKTAGAAEAASHLDVAINSLRQVEQSLAAAADLVGAAAGQPADHGHHHHHQ